MTDTSILIEAMEARAEALAGLGHRVRFDLTDTDETILLDATGPALSVTSGKEDAEAVLSMASDTLEKLITGKMSPMVAFSTGRLRVAGSQGVALKLAGLLND